MRTLSINEIQFISGAGREKHPPSPAYVSPANVPIFGGLGYGEAFALGSLGGGAILTTLGSIVKFGIAADPFSLWELGSTALMGFGISTTCSGAGLGALYGTGA